MEVVESELVRNDLIYIEPNSPSMKQYKRLIKDQCEEVCQDKMTADTILTNIKEFTFGFLHISTKAMIGARRLLKQSLNGFVFCTHTGRDNQIMIEIVCSRLHMKLGKRLMAAVEEVAIDMGVSTITLMSLAEENLKRWYESLGFEVRKAIHTGN